MSVSDIARSPNLQDKQVSAKEQLMFHARVDSTCIALKRFTAAQFKQKFGFIDPKAHGYKSLTDLFVMRGCVQQGGIFMYMSKSMKVQFTKDFHERVDATCGALKHFTSAEFEENFGSIDPNALGYKSLEDLFVIRGCIQRGEVFTYETNWLTDLRVFHGRVDATCGALKRFTSTEFEENFGCVNTRKYGYKSLEDVLITRGCVKEHGVFTYTGITSSVQPLSTNTTGNEAIPPPIFPPKISLAELSSFHGYVDAAMRELRRFSKSAFKKQLSKKGIFKHRDFGYNSVEHVLLFRGCHRSGSEFVFNKASATKAKALAVANYLEEFSGSDFKMVFRRFFVTSNPKQMKGRFESVAALLMSIGDIEADGSDRYILRKHVDHEAPRQQAVQGSTNTKTDEPRKNAAEVSIRRGEDDRFLHEQRCFNEEVDDMLDRLKSFTLAQFLNEMRNQDNLQLFGYESAIDLLRQRGCGRDAHRFFYDRVAANRWKSEKVMKKLGRFNEVVFRLAFCKCDLGTNDCQSGFKSFEAFMQSFTGIECVKREGEASKFVYHGAVDSDLGKREGYGEETQLKEKQYEKVLNVAKKLTNPFRENELQCAYKEIYYDDEAVLGYHETLVFPLFLEMVPGIEHIGNGLYRHDGGSVGGEANVVEPASGDRNRPCRIDPEERTLDLNGGRTEKTGNDESREDPDDVLSSSHQLLLKSKVTSGVAPQKPLPAESIGSIQSESVPATGQINERKMEERTLGEQEFTNETPNPDHPRDDPDEVSVEVRLEDDNFNVMEIDDVIELSSDNDSDVAILDNFDEATSEVDGEPAAKRSRIEESRPTQFNNTLVDDRLPQLLSSDVSSGSSSVSSDDSSSGSDSDSEQEEEETTHEECDRGELFEEGRKENEHFSRDSDSVSVEPAPVDTEYADDDMATGEVVADEEDAPSAEDSPILTDPSGAISAHSFYEYILRVSAVNGKWAKDQLVLITKQMEQDGAIGGIADPATRTSVDASDVDLTPSVIKALNELIIRYHNKLTNTVVEGAIRRGVDPKELGDMILNCLPKKSPQS